MSADCDLLIIGAGPAGLSAAVEGRRHGLRVILLDEQPAPGGQIWRALEQRANAGLNLLGNDDGLELVNAFRGCGADYRPGAQVWQINPGFTVFTTRDKSTHRITATTVLLATGAQERPVPFEGWTLPGIMTVGAAQILLKTSNQIPQDPVWIAGTGPLILLYACQLLDSGGKIAGILDTAPKENSRKSFSHLLGAMSSIPDLAKGMRWLKQIKRAGVQITKGVSGLIAYGNDKLEGFAYTNASGQQIRQQTDLLLVHEGVIPSIHITLGLGCQHDWRDDQLCFVPRLDEWGQTSIPSLYVAGDGAGIAGAEAAKLRGEIAAVGIAKQLKKLPPNSEDLAASARARLAKVLALRPLLDTLYRPRKEALLPSDATLACRCEEVTTKRIREAAAIGIAGPNQVKTFTRCGMGPCQGRECGYTVSTILADVSGQPMDTIGFYRIRPPLKPITVGQLAALEADDVPVM